MTTRGLISAALAVIAAACLLAGGVGLYARSEIVDDDAFAQRAAASVDDGAVRSLVSERVVDGLINGASEDLLSFRPLLEPAIGALIGTPQFRSLLEFALRDAHAVLFGTQRTSVVLDLDRAGALIIDALRGVSPKVARAIPRDVQPQLASVDPGDLEVDYARTLRRLADAAPWLLVASVLLAAASVALSVVRRRALSRIGVAVAVAGGIGAVGVWVLGQIVAVKAGDAASDISASRDQASDAATAIYDRLFGDLQHAWIVVAALGLAFAVVGSGTVRAGGFEAVEERARAVLRSPRPVARLARGTGALIAGLMLVLRPDVAIRAAIVLAGAALLVAGASELTGLVAGRPTRRERTPLRAQIGIGAACLALAAFAGVVVIAMLGRPEQGVAKAVVPEQGCNGMKALCNRRLNEVVFPATHNSFSAADQRGWLFANQRYGIQRQLDDGIRGFLLDVHQGVFDPSNGRVRTDLGAADISRNKVARELSPEGLAVADRLVGRVGLGDLQGQRKLYLCHTLCELGYEPLDAELRVFKRFLDSRPSTVLVFFIEPYVSPHLIGEALDRAGLLDQAATLARDEPLPTLGELIAQDRRLVVMAEKDGGQRPWYLDGFSFTQDTPLGAVEPRDFSCRRNRGTADSPLLMINHWVDQFPPPPTQDARIGGRFLADRVERCAKERRLVPNLIAVDFYDTSGVVDLARRLNSEPR